VLISSGANGAKEYRICSQKKDVTLPKGYFFGMSVSRAWHIYFYLLLFNHSLDFNS
jgi:hypothetical protein